MDWQLFFTTSFVLHNIIQNVAMRFLKIKNIVILDLPGDIVVGE